MKQLWQSDCSRDSSDCYEWTSYRREEEREEREGGAEIGERGNVALTDSAV